MLVFLQDKHTLRNNLYMLGLRKYSTGKYSVISVNEILFKSYGYSLQIPDSYEPHLKKVVFERAKHLIRQILSSIKWGTFTRRISIKSVKEWYDGTILFFLPTLNNQRALQGVYDTVSKQRDNIKWQTKAFSNETVPTILVTIVSLLYLPITYLKLKKLSAKEQRIACFYINYFIDAPGVIFTYFKILKKYKPECVILSNDHIMYMKALELVCEDLGIPTIYVQHASVSNAFPELHFKYSFLDGKDTLDK